MSTLEEVYSEWQNNPQFRDAFKKDPKLALKTWGYELLQADLDKMIKFKQNNEKLDDRVNK